MVWSSTNISQSLVSAEKIAASPLMWRNAQTASHPPPSPSSRRTHCLRPACCQKWEFASEQFSHLWWACDKMRTRFGLILNSITVSERISKITERTNPIPSIYPNPTRTTRISRVAFWRVPSRINRNHPINQTSTPSFYLSHSLEGCVPWFSWRTP